MKHGWKILGLLALVSAANAQSLTTSGVGLTSFSAGAASPLFTTSVANSSSAPALTFNIANAGALTLFGNMTGSAAAPTYTAASSIPLSAFGLGIGLTGYLYGNGTSAIAASTTIPTTALSGALQAAQFPALTGDVTTTAGSLATTLATVNSNVGTFQGITVNGKGLITAASNQNYLTANQTISLTGPVTGSGSTSIATTITPTITAAGPVGGATSIPVITYNAAGQLTAVTTAATVGSVSNSDGTVTVSGTATAPVISRAAITGDVSIPAASNTATLASVATAGTVGSANTVPVVTINAKGLTTTLSSATITPSAIGAVSSVTNSDGTITVTGTSGAPIVSRSALTGDASVPAGSNALTLATVLTSPGTYSSVTVNGKGLVTAGTNPGYLTGNQTITASGDCTGSGTTSLPLTCTKTNGTAFAPSATTDTTNASNISSGTLSAARSEAISGDLTKAAGSGTATVIGLNGTTLSGLATGLLKNTTTTGVPTIAVAGTDYVSPTGSGAGLSGVVTSVTGTSPIVSSGGQTPAISITPATSTVAGSLAAADKAFLNAYENATVVLATSNAYSNIACNGSTDDTSAWNTLVTNVPDRSIIQIPGCTTMLTSGNISEPAGKHLSFVGSGSSKTIIQSNNNASDFITVGDWYNTFQGITFQGLNTTVTNATALSSTATTLTVGSTANFPASGSFYVQTNLGWTLVSYTSISSSTVFAGVTTTTASTTVAGGPISVKTGGYAINDGTNTHSYLKDVQFNYVYNGWLNNGTQCGILDSSGFGTVNYDLQFNGANVNAIIHNFTADGIPPAVAHIEVEQAGSLLISDSDVIRAQTNMRANPTSPNGVFGVYAVNTYFDTATAVSGVANSGNGVLLQGTGNVQRIKITNSWLSSASHDGFWCNSTATTLPTDIELLNDNIYSNGVNGVDSTACQDIILKGNQIAGNATAGINLTAATGSVTKLIAEGNRIGPTGGIGANGTGVIVPTGTYGAVELRGNDLFGNTTAALTLGTITVANWSQYAITDNPGYNPHGSVTTPTFPTSTTVVTNTTGLRVEVFFKSGTTAPTVLTVNGVSTVLPLASQIVTVPLDPGGTFANTYTVTAGTWTWVGN